MRALALDYAPSGSRDSLDALFALDSALGNILRTTSEPLVGRMRLTWWREALEKLDSAPAPAEPVLQALSTHVVGRHDVTGGRLAEQAVAWEWLLVEPLDPGAVLRHAALRADLFDIAAALCGHGDCRLVNRAGRGWAFADLSRNLDDRILAEGAKARGTRWLQLARRERWPRELRALGALALIAEADLRGKRSAGTVFRLGWHRITGR